MALQKPHFSARFKFLFPEAFFTIRTVSASPVEGQKQDVPGPANTASGQVNENAGKQKIDVQFNVYANQQSALDKGEAIETVTKTYYEDSVTNIYAQAESLAAKEMDATVV